MSNEKKKRLVLIEGAYAQMDPRDQTFDFERVFFNLPNFGIFPVYDRCVVSQAAMQQKVAMSGRTSNHGKKVSFIAPGLSSNKLRDKEGDNALYRYFIVVAGREFTNRVIGNDSVASVESLVGRPFRKGDEITVPFHVNGIADFPKLISPVNNLHEEMVGLHYTEVAGYIRHDITEHLTEFGLKQISREIWNQIMEVIFSTGQDPEGDMPSFFEFANEIEFQSEDLENMKTLIRDSYAAYQPEKMKLPLREHSDKYYLFLQDFLQATINQLIRFPGKVREQANQLKESLKDIERMKDSPVYDEQMRQADFVDEIIREVDENIIGSHELLLDIWEKTFMKVFCL